MVKKKLYKPIILHHPNNYNEYTLYISLKKVPITDPTKEPLLLYDYYCDTSCTSNTSKCIFNKNNIKLNIDTYEANKYTKMIPIYLAKKQKINIENNIELSLKSAIGLIEKHFH